MNTESVKAAFRKAAKDIGSLSGAEFCEMLEKQKSKKGFIARALLELNYFVRDKTEAKYDIFTDGMTDEQKKQFEIDYALTKAEMEMEDRQ